MKNDLLFAVAELRAIRVCDDDVFRMANARAAIGRAIETIESAEQDAGKQKKPVEKKEAEEAKK